MSKLKLEELRCELQPYVNQLNTTENRRRYIAGDFPRADKVKDLNVRFRFDVLYAIPAKIRHPIMDRARELGGNDTHVASLLKSMIHDLV